MGLAGQAEALIHSGLQFQVAWFAAMDIRKRRSPLKKEKVAGSEPGELCRSGRDCSHNEKFYDVALNTSLIRRAFSHKDWSDNLAASAGRVGRQSDDGVF